MRIQYQARTEPYIQGAESTTSDKWDSPTPVRSISRVILPVACMMSLAFVPIIFGMNQTPIPDVLVSQPRPVIRTVVPYPAFLPVLFGINQIPIPEVPAWKPQPSWRILLTDNPRVPIVAGVAETITLDKWNGQYPARLNRLGMLPLQIFTAFTQIPVIYGTSLIITTDQQRSDSLYLDAITVDLDSDIASIDAIIEGPQGIA